MNEWTAAAPIVVETQAQPAPRRRQTGRPLLRWTVGLVAALALFLVWSGGLLIIGQAVWQYTIQDMIPPIVMLAAGQIVVIALVYAIAWRTGRLS